VIVRIVVVRVRLRHCSGKIGAGRGGAQRVVTNVKIKFMKQAGNLYGNVCLERGKERYMDTLIDR
jgi:hypothetical protein